MKLAVEKWWSTVDQNGAIALQRKGAWELSQNKNCGHKWKILERNRILVKKNFFGQNQKLIFWQKKSKFCPKIEVLVKKFRTKDKNFLFYNSACKMKSDLQKCIKNLECYQTTNGIFKQTCRNIWPLKIDFWTEKSDFFRRFAPYIYFFSIFLYVEQA